MLICLVPSFHSLIVAAPGGLSLLAQAVFVGIAPLPKMDSTAASFIPISITSYLAVAAARQRQGENGHAEERHEPQTDCLDHFAPLLALSVLDRTGKVYRHAGYLTRRCLKRVIRSIDRRSLSGVTNGIFLAIAHWRV